MGVKDISLRDYFAAQAMQAFLSGHMMHYGHEEHWAYDEIASVAYEMAAEMLKERVEHAQ